MGLDRVKLLAARYRAASQRPYLASALYALSIVESEGVGTMGVDRHWRCYVAPAFVDATGVPELAGVWIHEVAHLLRDHHGRAGRLPLADQRDRVRVNVAQDCEINDDLLADRLPLPANRIEPRTFGLRAGRLFEEYLPDLPPMLESCDCGSGAHGQPAPWEYDGPGGPPRVGEVEADAIRRHTASEIRAHQRARGTVPLGWQRWADRVLEPTVDWRRVLAGAVREALAWASGAVDYTYRRPSRRSAAVRGAVLPTLRRPLPRVAVVVDTSGSMRPEDLADAMAEVTGVLRQVGVGTNRLTVLACDADVQAVSRVSRADEVKLAGGGGTDMRVAINAVLAGPANWPGRGRDASSESARSDRPQVVVVLTDGYTPWPAEPVSCRLIAGLIGADPPVPPSWVEVVRIG